MTCSGMTEVLPQFLLCFIEKRNAITGQRLKETDPRHAREFRGSPRRQLAQFKQFRRSRHPDFREHSSGVSFNAASTASGISMEIVFIDHLTSLAHIWITHNVTVASRNWSVKLPASLHTNQMVLT